MRRQRRRRCGLLATAARLWPCRNDSILMHTAGVTSSGERRARCAVPLLAQCPTHALRWAVDRSLSLPLVFEQERAPWLVGELAGWIVSTNKHGAKFSAERSSGSKRDIEEYEEHGKLTISTLYIRSQEMKLGKHQETCEREGNGLRFPCCWLKQISIARRCVRNSSMESFVCCIGRSFLLE